MLYAVGFSKTDVCDMRFARITHTKNRTAYLPTAYSVYTLTLSYLDRVVDNLGLLRRNYAYPTKTPKRRIGTQKKLNLRLQRTWYVVYFTCYRSSNCIYVSTQACYAQQSIRSTK